MFVKEIMTRTERPASDYAVNPYIGCTHNCKYCYACYMKRFTNHREDWGTFLDVRNWPKIENPEKYAGKSVFFGTVTDPYNPHEEVYGRTRQLLTQLQGSGAKITIQTKSDLVLRDIDLIKTFPDIRVGFSINILDENFRKDMDNAVSIERRLAAMRKIHDEGIKTSCFISPIFPDITDVESIIKAVINQCNYIWLENLNLRGEFKPVIMKYIAKKYTYLNSLYNEIYNCGNKKYWEDLDKRLKIFAEGKGLEYVYNNDNMDQPFDAPPVVVNYFYHEKIKKK